MNSLSRVLDPAFRKVFYSLDRADRQDGKAFDRPEMLVPHVASRFYGWTHYGLMIPDLPAPHRFFSIMSLIGTPGAQAFDMDYCRQASPRRCATVVAGTAVSHPAHFGSYVIDRDCDFRADGSVIRFGNEVAIRGQYPEYHVHAKVGGCTIELQVLNTDKVSWFIKNPVYEHISLLSQYRGLVISNGKALTVSGLCAFEYGACVSPYVVRDRELAWAHKVPLDFFFYNIINLDDKTQILLSYCTMKGLSVNRSAMIRSLDRYNQTWRDIDLEIEAYQPEPALSPDGMAMRLPASWRWLVRERGELVLALVAASDTPFTYGLGNGYVGGFSYSGHYRGQALTGTGYVEFIDVRGLQPRRC